MVTLWLCVCLLQVAGLETVLGTEHHWSMMLSLSLIPALTQYLVLPFCPESPRYLLLNQREERKAEAGGSRDVQQGNNPERNTAHIAFGSGIKRQKCFHYTLLSLWTHHSGFSEDDVVVTLQRC